MTQSEDCSEGGLIPCYRSCETPDRSLGAKKPSSNHFSKVAKRSWNRSAP